MRTPTGDVAHEWRVWHTTYGYNYVDQHTLYSVQVRRDGAWHVWVWDHRVGYWDEVCPHDAAGRRLEGQGYATEQTAVERAQGWTVTSGGRRWRDAWVVSADERGVSPAEHARWQVLPVEPLPPWMTGLVDAQLEQLAQDAGSTRVWPERLRRLGGLHQEHQTLPLDAAGETYDQP